MSRYKKLTDWYFDNNGIKRENAVIKAFKDWYKNNLTITHGDGRTPEELFGLPYTSSSDFGALWNCQAEAYLNADRHFYFQGLAISTENDVIVMFDNMDESEHIEIIIGKLFF